MNEFKDDKVVAFARHRYEWHCIGLAYYHHDKEKYDLPSCYDGSILPEIEELHYKQKITKRNEWIIDHCNILVCHIEETYKSGAYRTLKYAQKQNKPIIYI